MDSKIAEEARRTALLLRRFIRRASHSERRLSRVLGLHPDSLSRILRGERRLSVRLVFEVLGVLGVRPADFYGELYDFADLLTHYPGERKQPLTDAEMERFVRQQVKRVAGGPGRERLRRGRRPSAWERAAGTVNVDYELERLCEELWFRIKRTGLTDREVSRRLGRPPDHLSRVLRRSMEPAVEDVLEALKGLETWPDEFYEEYYGVRGGLAHLAHPEWRLTRGLPWGDAEDWFYDSRDEFRQIRRRKGRGAATWSRPGKPTGSRGGSSSRAPGGPGASGGNPED